MPGDTKLVSDQPICNFEDDLLGREPFVRALNEVFSAWDSNIGLVLGLNAPWGEGKTSVLNLLTPVLEANGFNVIRFNPWQWSSREHLQDVFFDELSVEIGHLSRKRSHEIARTVRRYAVRLKGIAKASSITIPILKGLLFVSFVPSVLAVFWPSITLASLTLLMIILAALATFATQLVEALVNVFAPSGSKELDPTLDQLRGKLQKELRSWDGKLIVIMDDLDRLAADDAAEIIRLVKSNGDLPRVCYVLVGDRKILDHHIGKKLDVDGSAYMEKIVQFSFDLPAIDRAKLQSVFFEGFKTISDSDLISHDFKVPHWREVYWCIEPLFCTLRTVKRFIETLRFHTRLLTGEAAFEVNVTDLVGIEAIRVFNPTLYEWTKRNRSILAGNSLSAEERTVTESLFNGMTEDERPIWEGLLKALFPVLTLTGSNQIGADTTRTWVRDRRVASAGHFLRYFRFGVSREELSESSVKRVLESNNAAEIRALLEANAADGLLETTIERIRASVATIRMQNIPPLVTAIFDVGDALSLQAKHMFGVGSVYSAEFTVDEIIQRATSDRALLIDTAFLETKGVKLPIIYFCRVLRKKAENQLNFPLDDEMLAAWKKLWATRLAEIARRGAIFEMENPGYYLFLWSEWGDPEEVKTFVARMTESREGALRFLRGMVQISRISDGSGEEKERPYIKHSDLSRFISPEVIAAAIAVKGEMDEELLKLTNPEFTYFLRTLKAFREGQSDDGFQSWNDEEDV